MRVVTAIKPALLSLGLALGFGLTLAGNAPGDPARVDRARANYQALMSGRIQLNQLTPRELADVVDLDDALRERDERSPSQRCIDQQVNRAGGSPSRLAREVIDLMCREPGAGLD